MQRRESAPGESFAQGSASALSHDEECAAAFSKVAFLAPHAQPLVLRFFATASHPLSRCPEVLSDPLAVRRLAFATLRLCEAVGAPLERAWRGQTAAAAARLVHSPDAPSRWAAAALLERSLRLGAQAASSLRESLLTSSEARLAASPPTNPSLPARPASPLPLSFFPLSVCASQPHAAPSSPLSFPQELSAGMEYENERIALEAERAGWFLVRSPQRRVRAPCGRGAAAAGAEAPPQRGFAPSPGGPARAVMAPFCQAVTVPSRAGPLPQGAEIKRRREDVAWRQSPGHSS